MSALIVFAAGAASDHAALLHVRDHRLVDADLLHAVLLIAHEVADHRRACRHRQHEAEWPTERVPKADPERDREACADRDLLGARAVDDRVLRERERRLARGDQQRDDVALAGRPAAVVVLADRLLEERVVGAVQALRSGGGLLGRFSRVLRIPPI